MNKPNTKRLKEIASIALQSGKHASLETGACIMELVSYVAREAWSDHPECACQVLTSYAIALNDRFNSEHRQLLKPFIPKLIGTRSTDKVQVARLRLFRWRYVTAIYPYLLDLLQLPEIAAKLRTFENNPESMAQAKQFLDASKPSIKRANAYAYANAYANANAYAKADAYAYADADASAYAYADAYAYAKADAHAMRKRLVEINLETLQMAIDTKAK